MKITKADDLRPERTALPPVKVVGDVARIELTRGYEATVDTSATHFVSSQFWFARLAASGPVYATTKIRMPDGKWRQMHMHRLILGVQGNEQVDHINGNGLDNRRMNLRIATPRQNTGNRRPCGGGVSRFKGVYLDRRSGRWQAAIGQRHKGIKTQKHLGSFGSEIEAAQAYDREAVLRYGEFANLNLPEAQDESTNQLAR